MIKQDIGIDLGSSNIRIYLKSKNIIINEPSIIAIEKETKKVLAVGKKAKNMLGKTPSIIESIKPIEKGSIIDLEITEILISSIIKNIKSHNLLIKPNLVFSTPCNITPIEKETFMALGERLGAKNTILVNNIKMSFQSLNLSSPILMLDIGGGKTDIAILSFNEIVKQNSIKIAGNEFNNDLIKYIKDKYKVLVGEQTIEKFKLSFANVHNASPIKNQKITGKDLITGLPVTLELTEFETKVALEESLSKITNLVRTTLESSPPDLVTEITDKGLLVTGGSAKLKGLLEELQERLSLRVLITTNNKTSTIEGIKTEILNDKYSEEDQ